MDGAWDWSVGIGPMLVVMYTKMSEMLDRRKCEAKVGKEGLRDR